MSNSRNRVYTVTCNPALDCTVQLDCLSPGQLHRTQNGHLTPGGKGINVALVLQELGVDVTAGGFLAGETGKLLETLLHQRGLKTDFVYLSEGSTRINVKLLEQEPRRETELNAMGPAVPEDRQCGLGLALREMNPGDVLCLCGSLAPGLPSDFYGRLCAFAKSKGVYTVVDAEGTTLRASLSGQPFLVKPNLAELSGFAGHSLEGTEAIVEAAHGLQQEGAQNVLVSLGADGALLCTSKGAVYRIPAPEGKVCGTVGAGDSMLAGFVAGCLNSGSLTEALRWGAAAGSGTAFSPNLTDLETFQLLLIHLSQPEQLA